MRRLLRNQGIAVERNPGCYVNPSADSFEAILAGKVYVDKTELIAYTNAVMNTPFRFLCVSRPRRFGKTFAAKMLAAYYSRGADSRALFQNLKIATAPRDKFPPWDVPPFEQHLNQCDVLFWDMTRFVVNGAGVGRTVKLLNEELLRELKQQFPQIDASDVHSVSGMLLAIYLATGRRFYIIIDEWDALFREAKSDTALQKEYIDFLRELFKDAQSARSICGAYMTGILPIKKYGTQSALTDFTEFTMVQPGRLAEYVGFTEAEASDLCRRYSIDFDEARRWYDGYQFAHAGHVYSPNSIIQAVVNRAFEGYWTQTETWESLKRYLELNVSGLKDDITAMLGGHRCSIDARSFSNDLVSVDTRDKVLTLLVHLGYLAYDAAAKEVYIPNEEIREEFIRSLRNGKRSEVSKAIELSDKILTATLARDEDRVAQLLGEVHLAHAATNFYANEQALRSVVLMAYLSGRDHYTRFEEIGGGRGYADLLFVPLPGGGKPPIVIELKKGASAETALQQIKTRQYARVLERFNCHGKVLLVGITFDTGSNRHQCRIEETIVE